jgi:hypothetical protein
MSIGRCDRRPIRRTARAAALALGCAALPTACGRGISLDPIASDWPHNDNLDGAKPDGEASGPDVLDASAGDVSLDNAGAQDAAEEIDASAPPDVLEDSSVDASETLHADTGLEVDVAPDGFDDRSSDSDGAIEDVGDDSFDARADSGDGCTLACGWPEADYYVDAHALADGNGSRLAPFKTITRAIAAYRETPGQPKSVYVAAGTYDRALGEQFPLALRGLSLKGAGRDLTLIVGTGTLDHAPEGGAFHDQYLVTLVAGDVTLNTAISDVSVRSESPVPALNYYGVFCDRGSATGEVVAPAGQTELDRVSVGPGYHGSVLATTSTTASTVTGCNIVIRSSFLTGGWAGLRAYGCDTSRLSGPVVVEMGGPDPSSANVISWMQAPGDSAAGASLEGCVIRASFQNNAFVDGVYGLSIDDKGVPLGSLGLRPFTIKHNSFERLRAGGILAVGGSIQIDELSDNRFVGITRAVSQDPGPRAVALSISLLRLGKVRRNHFIGNDFGVLLAVPGASAQAAADFGTASDPGGNVFRCNSALKEAGADLAFMGDSANPNGSWVGTIHLAGNAWDHAPPTARADDPIPNGCDISRLRIPNVTLDVQDSSVATAVCPPDRVPGQ